MWAAVRVEPIDGGFGVVLEDEDQLVLAHYDAREDAECYAAQVRSVLLPRR